MDLGNHPLLPGETLLWSGRPQRFSLRPPDVLLLAFGAVWMGGVSLSVLGGDRGHVLTFFPVAFLIIGFAGTWGRVLYGRLVLRSTTYLLTDRRLVAVSTRPKYSELSEYLTRLAPPVLKPAADGTGSIGFGALDLASQMAAMSGMKRNPANGAVFLELRAIPDAALVRDLIANAQAKAAP